jgi:integrase
MAAKLREKDGFYWVVVHHQGRRKWKKIGRDKREALKVVHKVNAMLAIGEFSMEPERKVPTISEALLSWHADYKPTFSPSFAHVAKTNIEHHLIPAFGKLRVTEIEERHLLQFISAKTKDDATPRPLKASTLNNILSVLRRVLALEVEDGHIQRNPCRNLGRLLAKVKRQQSREVEQVRSWSREEVAILLRVTKVNEPRFHAFLAFLLHTGCRKGEACALKWEDVDWQSSRVSIRRSISRGQLSPPKSGKARSIALSPALAEILDDLLTERRRECLKRLWPEVPKWVFCSETGGLLDPSNITRTWYRVRRHAQAEGVRPLRLHDARHSYASLALAAGKSVRWVAAQLGHSNPELTLRVYAHALREEETDLSFLDFGGTRRHPRGTERKRAVATKKPLRATPRRGSRFLEQKTGLDPVTRTLVKGTQPGWIPRAS